MNSTLPSFSSIFFASAQSSSQVLLMCLAGFVAAKFDIVTANIQKDLSTLIIKIFMPCFLFSNIVATITIKRLISLWPIAAFFFLFTFISSGLGLVGGKLLRLRNVSDTKFVMLGIVFNNVTSLTLGLLKGIENTSAIALLKLDDNESPSDTVKRGISYVLLATLWSNLLRWSFGAYLLKKVPEKDDLSLPQQTPNTPNTPSSSSQFHPEIELTERSPLLRPNPLWPRVKKALTFKFMNPPLYAALFALIFVAIPPSKSLFVGKDAPLMALFQAIDYLGSIAIPLTLLTLGSQLHNLSRSHNSRIASMIVYIMICRFLIMPTVGIFSVLSTRYWYFNNPMFLFILILLPSGPSAISSINLAQLTDSYQEEVSTLLFYSYIVATPMVTILVMFILNYIKDIQ